MRVVTIGDVHGSQKWKNAVYQVDQDNGEILGCYLDTTIDKVVFIGDYVDSFGLTNFEIFHNLKEIIQLKKDYPDDVILLWGNHDVAYLKNDDKITGYRFTMAPDLYQLFNDNYRLFQLAYQHDNVIWTHAGIHDGWWKYYALPVIDKYKITRFTDLIDDCNNTQDYLNLMFEFNYDPIFAVSHHRGGKSKEGGPLWADKVELYTKPLKGFHQVVGHTKVPNIKTYDFKENTKVTFVDCLPVSDDFFKIDLG